MTIVRMPIYQMVNERNANPFTCSHWHVLFLFQKQPWVPRKTTEGPRRPVVNCDAWEETLSQYLLLKKQTLFHLACNALYDNDGVGYDQLPTPLKIRYEKHINYQ